MTAALDLQSLSLSDKAHGLLCSSGFPIATCLKSGDPGKQDTPDLSGPCESENRMFPVVDHLVNELPVGAWDGDEHEENPVFRTDPKMQSALLFAGQSASGLGAPHSIAPSVAPQVNRHPYAPVAPGFKNSGYYYTFTCADVCYLSVYKGTTPIDLTTTTSISTIITNNFDSLQLCATYNALSKRLLLLSGDIHPNPGPTCPICRRKVSVLIPGTETHYNCRLCGVVSIEYDSDHSDDDEVILYPIEPGTDACAPGPSSAITVPIHPITRDTPAPTRPSFFAPIRTYAPAGPPVHPHMVPTSQADAQRARSYRDAYKKDKTRLTEAVERANAAVKAATKAFNASGNRVQLIQANLDREERDMVRVANLRHQQLHRTNPLASKLDLVPTPLFNSIKVELDIAVAQREEANNSVALALRQQQFDVEVFDSFMAVPQDVYVSRLLMLCGDIESNPGPGHLFFRRRPMRPVRVAQPRFNYAQYLNRLLHHIRCWYRVAIRALFCLGFVCWFWLYYPIPDLPSYSELPSVTISLGDLPVLDFDLTAYNLHDALRILVNTLNERKLLRTTLLTAATIICQSMYALPRLFPQKFPDWCSHPSTMLTYRHLRHWKHRWVLALPFLARMLWLNTCDLYYSVNIVTPLCLYFASVSYMLIPCLTVTTSAALPTLTREQSRKLLWPMAVFFSVGILYDTLYLAYTVLYSYAYDTSMFTYYHSASMVCQMFPASFSDVSWLNDKCYYYQLLKPPLLSTDYMMDYAYHHIVGLPARADFVFTMLWVFARYFIRKRTFTQYANTVVEFVILDVVWTAAIAPLLYLVLLCTLTLYCIIGICAIIGFDLLTRCYQFLRRHTILFLFFISPLLCVFTFLVTAAVLLSPVSIIAHYGYKVISHAPDPPLYVVPTLGYIRRTLFKQKFILHVDFNTAFPYSKYTACAYAHINKAHRPIPYYLDDYACFSRFNPELLSMQGHPVYDMTFDDLCHLTTLTPTYINSPFLQTDVDGHCGVPVQQLPVFASADLPFIDDFMVYPHYCTLTYQRSVDVGGTKQVHYGDDFTSRKHLIAGVTYKNWLPLMYRGTIYGYAQAKYKHESKLSDALRAVTSFAAFAYSHTHPVVGCMSKCGAKTGPCVEPYHKVMATPTAKPLGSADSFLRAVGTIISDRVSQLAKRTASDPQQPPQYVDNSPVEYAPPTNPNYIPPPPCDVPCGSCSCAPCKCYSRSSVTKGPRSNDGQVYMKNFFGFPYCGPTPEAEVNWVMPEFGQAMVRLALTSTHTGDSSKRYFYEGNLYDGRNYSCLYDTFQQYLARPYISNYLNGKYHYRNYKVLSKTIVKGKVNIPGVLFRSKLDIIKYMTEPVSPDDTYSAYLYHLMSLVHVYDEGHPTPVTLLDAYQADPTAGVEAHSLFRLLSAHHKIMMPHGLFENLNHTWLYYTPAPDDTPNLFGTTFNITTTAYTFIPKATASYEAITIILPDLASHTFLCLNDRSTHPISSYMPYTFDSELVRHHDLLGYRHPSAFRHDRGCGCSNCAGFLDPLQPRPPKPTCGCCGALKHTHELPLCTKCTADFRAPRGTKTKCPCGVKLQKGSPGPWCDVTCFCAYKGKVAADEADGPKIDAKSLFGDTNFWGNTPPPASTALIDWLKLKHYHDYVIRGVIALGITEDNYETFLMPTVHIAAAMPIWLPGALASYHDYRQKLIVERLGAYRSDYKPRFTYHDPTPVHEDMMALLGSIGKWGNNHVPNVCRFVTPRSSLHTCSTHLNINGRQTLSGAFATCPSPGPCVNDSRGNSHFDLFVLSGAVSFFLDLYSDCSIVHIVYESIPFLTNLLTLGIGTALTGIMQSVRAAHRATGSYLVVVDVVTLVCAQLRAVSPRLDTRGVYADPFCQHKLVYIGCGPTNPYDTFLHNCSVYGPVAMRYFTDHCNYVFDHTLYGTLSHPTLPAELYAIQCVPDPVVVHGLTFGWRLAYGDFFGDPFVPAGNMKLYVPDIFPGNVQLGLRADITFDGAMHTLRMNGAYLQISPSVYSTLQTAIASNTTMLDVIRSSVSVLSRDPTTTDSTVVRILSQSIQAQRHVVLPRDVYTFGPKFRKKRKRRWFGIPDFMPSFSNKICPECGLYRPLRYRWCDGICPSCSDRWVYPKPQDRAYTRSMLLTTGRENGSYAYEYGKRCHGGSSFPIAPTNALMKEKPQTSDGQYSFMNKLGACYQLFDPLWHLLGAYLGRPAMVAVGILWGSMTYSAFGKTVHNEGVAVQTRITSTPGPIPDKHSWRRVNTLAPYILFGDSYAPFVMPIPFCDPKLLPSDVPKPTANHNPGSDWLSGFNPARRNVLLNAYVALHRGLLNVYERRNCTFKTFVKDEITPNLSCPGYASASHLKRPRFLGRGSPKKYEETVSYYETMPGAANPRAIQAPPDWTHVVMGPWFVALANTLKQQWRQGSYIYGGHVPEVLDSALHDVSNGFCLKEGNIVLTLDFSTFDCSHNAYSFAVLERIYRLCGMDTTDPLVEHILAMWRSPKGNLPRGVQYRRRYMNASGRDDTSVLNCIINVIAVTTALASTYANKPILQLTKKDINYVHEHAVNFFLGDDSLIVAPDLDLDKLKYNLSVLGFAIKASKSTSLMSATFLGRHPTPGFCPGDTQERLYWGRTPGRATPKLGLARLRQTNYYRWLAAVTVGVLTSDFHVPVLGDTALHLTCINSLDPCTIQPDSYNKFIRTTRVERASKPSILLFLSEVYGVTEHEYDEFLALLASIGTLPAELDCSLCRKMVLNDDC